MILNASWILLALFHENKRDNRLIETLIPLCQAEHESD